MFNLKTQITQKNTANPLETVFTAKVTRHTS